MSDDQGPASGQQQMAAVFIPSWVTEDRQERYVRSCLDGDRSLDGLCLHENTKPTTGRWVCVLEAGHDPAHVRLAS